MKHFALDNSSWAYFLYEYAGIPGPLLCGGISDTVFRVPHSLTRLVFQPLVHNDASFSGNHTAGDTTLTIACTNIHGYLL